MQTLYQNAEPGNHDCRSGISQRIKKKKRAARIRTIDRIADLAEAKPSEPTRIPVAIVVGTVEKTATAPVRRDPRNPTTKSGYPGATIPDPDLRRQPLRHDPFDRDWRQSPEFSHGLRETHGLESV